ncbi:hypothetical protein CMQ_1799 [Grosmannia clavigera kw1407]|uniref:Tat pathway signal sequence n=1 Tax=Grosmannia clavigera (strain kw1407 / UAMH 11150) TaxID=655863 RepID=F0XAY6_GROCL|nr:uncharacterized protein CMQ_1799 [Grosmannia clavigera kw1407]EFX05163.1 hypothetical protein CMQ_1799 [Grosmannia clavigera kw1407]
MTKFIVGPSDNTLVESASTAASSRPSTPRSSISISLSAAPSPDTPLIVNPPYDDVSDSESSRLTTPAASSMTSLSSASSLACRILDMADVSAAIANVARESEPDRRSPSLLEPEPSIEHSPAARPRSARRSRAVQGALSDAKTAMENLRDVLASDSLHLDSDSTIGRLHKRTEALACFECLSSRTVGFVGASGVGKSSLLNALLDTRGLARANGNGDACTSVVTEYHYHDRNDFVLDVEMFAMDEVVEQIGDLLKSLRQYHNCLRTHYKFTDKDEQEDIESRAKIASDTFQAMFRSRMEDEQYLLDGSEESILATLCAWTDDLMPRHIGGRQTLDSLAACSRVLMQLTSETNAEPQPAVWPYIRKIKVFLNAHILSKGLVLVDLPGLRDVNLARQVITELYLRECDDIFAVTCTNRAAADAGVKDVFELGQKAGLSNIGIICTKSDEVEAAEATDRTTQQLQRAVEGSQKNANAIEYDIRELEQLQREDDLLPEEEKELADLLRRSRNIRTVLESQKIELKIHLVNTLTAGIDTKLWGLYSRFVPGGHRLQVFCVSSKDYWEIRAQPKTDVVVRLLNVSGIPAVRKHCLAMVADSNLRIAAKFVRDDIPALLGDIGLWVQSGAGCLVAEQKTAIRDALDALERRLKTEAIEGMTIDLRPRWAALRLDSVVRQQKHISAHLKDTLGQEVEHLEIEGRCEEFEDDLSSLETDALTGIRSSLIGKAMEEVYRASANTSGRGSHRVRVDIINGTITQQSTFDKLLRDFKKCFNDLADGLQRDASEMAMAHLGSITETLNIVRSENIITESEQNPEFRLNVDAGVGAATDAVQRIQRVVA